MKATLNSELGFDNPDYRLKGLFREADTGTPEIKSFGEGGNKIDK